MSDPDPRDMLLASLAEVSERFDAKADDWQYSLVRTFREYLRATGVDPHLVAPVQALLNDTAAAAFVRRKKERGPRQGDLRKPLAEAMPLAFATGAARRLKWSHGLSIDVALREVSKASGLSAASLKTFHANVSSRNVSAALIAMVEDAFKKTEAWSRDEVIGACANLRRFVS